MQVVDLGLRIHIYAFIWNACYGFSIRIHMFKWHNVPIVKTGHFKIVINVTRNPGQIFFEIAHQGVRKVNADPQPWACCLNLTSIVLTKGGKLK